MKADAFNHRDTEAQSCNTEGRTTAELASQAHHEMGAPNFETASRNVVAKYAESDL
jgi:hypothetical protein